MSLSAPLEKAALKEFVARCPALGFCCRVYDVCISFYMSLSRLWVLTTERSSSGGGFRF